MSTLPQYGKRLHPSATMRAVVIDRYGPPDELRPTSVPQPVPGRGQVLVRVRFIGVNPKDLMIRKGNFKALTGRRFPLIVGHDIAGEVLEAAPGADLAPGERVFGMINDLAGRAYAEYAAVDAGQLARAPASIGTGRRPCRWAAPGAAAVRLSAQTTTRTCRGLRRTHRPGSAHTGCRPGSSCRRPWRCAGPTRRHSGRRRRRRGNRGTPPST